MNRVLWVAAYLAAIVAANLTTAHFGPGASIWVAFLFIGFDLVARDHLHDQWRAQGRWAFVAKMAALIATGGLLSYALNVNAGPIALASCLAFAAAATVDAAVYQLLRHKPHLFRVNGSNIPAALADSLVFPTIAFGGFMWPIVLGQFAAKALGGFLWSLLLRKIR